MKLSEPFKTKRMKFRLLEESDLEVICRQFSDEDMCRYFNEAPCDIEEAKGIIEHYQNPEGKDHLRYGMFDINTDAFIGTCGYHYWDQEQKQVELGYDIWKDYLKQGYISEALPVLINICFSQLGVDCIYIFTHPQNEVSIASVRKFGFKESEPCRTPDVEDQVCMKLMKTEWNFSDINVETTLADSDTANIIRNIYPLYLYDLSEIYGNVPNEFGIYEDEPIKTLEEQYHVQDIWFQKPGVLFPYIIFVNQKPAGFALVSTKEYAPKDVDYYLYEFFLLRPYRGKNIAEIAATQVFNRYKGKWAVHTGQTSSNKRAQSFWNKTIKNYTSNQFESAIGMTFDGEKLRFIFNN